MATRKCAGSVTEFRCHVLNGGPRAQPCTQVHTVARCPVQETKGQSLVRNDLASLDRRYQMEADRIVLMCLQINSSPPILLVVLGVLVVAAHPTFEPEANRLRPNFYAGKPKQTTPNISSNTRTNSRARPPGKPSAPSRPRRPRWTCRGMAAGRNLKRFGVWIPNTLAHG